MKTGLVMWIIGAGFTLGLLPVVDDYDVKDLGTWDRVKYSGSVFLVWPIALGTVSGKILKTKYPELHIIKRDKEDNE